MELGVTELVARLGLHALDGGQGVANFTLEAEGFAGVGAPVLGDVVFVAMAVGAAGRVAGRHVHHGGADFAAELDHVGDAGGVDLDGLFQRRLEVHQPGAVHDGVQTAGLERLGFFAEEAVIGDVAGNDDDLFFDVAIELVAEVLAQRAEHGRVENLAAEAAGAAAPVAANEQIDALDFGMPSQEDREEHLAQESGRAGQQDATVFEHLLERRHSSSVAFAVATRHRRSPAAAGAGRLSRPSVRGPRSPSRLPRRACRPLPIRGAPPPPALRIRLR